jgi:hypothetical protein
VNREWRELSWSATLTILVLIVLAVGAFNLFVGTGLTSESFADEPVLCEGVDC